ncbi:MAG: ABC transporter ATP-binding protein [candidate division WOR-3 bacterium]
MIEIKNISYKEKNQEILKNISLTIKEKECFAILGPNGAGKTTLMELMVSLIKPLQGEIKFLGKNFETVKDKIGVLFENPPLFYYAKVNEVIEYLACIYNIKKEKIIELIKKLEMDEIFKREIRKLSKGERKKLGLLISLINDPLILILDEPTSGMDPFIREKIWEVIKSKERTVVFSTHIWEEAEKYADRILLLDKGKILAIDSPSDFLSEKYMRFKNKIVLNNHPDLYNLIEKEFYIKKEDKIYIYPSNPEDFIKKIKNFEYNFCRINLEDVFLFLKAKQ